MRKDRVIVVVAEKRGKKSKRCQCLKELFYEITFSDEIILCDDNIWHCSGEGGVKSAL